MYELEDIVDIYVWFNTLTQEWVTTVYFCGGWQFSSMNKDTTQPTRRYA